MSQSSLIFPDCAQCYFCSASVQHCTCFLPPRHLGPWPENSIQKMLGFQPVYLWAMISQWSHNTDAEGALEGDFSPVGCVISTTLNLLGNPLNGDLTLSIYHYLKFCYGFAYRFGVALHWRVNFKKAGPWSIFFPAMSPLPRAVRGTREALST